MDFSKIQKKVYNEYRKNGYESVWTNAELQLSSKQGRVIIMLAELGLVHTEVSEAVEACRNGDGVVLGKELADIIIRVMNFASRVGLPFYTLEEYILQKDNENKKRSKLHGRPVFVKG